MYHLLCTYYPKSVSFTEMLMDFYIYDDILGTIQLTDKKLLHFKLSKLGQILRVDKTCFPRPGHILCWDNKNSFSFASYLQMFTKLGLFYCFANVHCHQVVKEAVGYMNKPFDL